MLRSRFQALTTRSIEDVVARVAVEYFNLDRQRNSKVSVETGQSKLAMLLAKLQLGYSKKSDNEFVFFVSTDPYILKNSQNEHFYFPGGIHVGRNLVISGDNILLTGEPMVLTQEQYNHPFVHSGNSICFASDDRWSENGIFWNRPYSLNDAVTYRKIAYWLNEGTVALKNGYFGGVIPVSCLTRGNFSNEYLDVWSAKQKGIEIVGTKNI